MSTSVTLSHDSPKEITPNFILNLTKVVLVDTSSSVTVYVKGKKDKFIVCHLSAKFPEFNINLSFAPSEPVEFSCVASKAPAKKDTSLVTLFGVDTQLVPAPSHLEHWALPSDESDDEDSDHADDWRLDLMEAGSQSGSDEEDGHDHHDHHHHHDHDHKHDHKHEHEDKSSKKRKREEEKPVAAAAEHSKQASTAVPDAKKPKKEFQKIKLLRPQLRKHASGVQFTETVMGDGPAIKYGKVVTIKFTCKLPTSGHVVDQGERTFRYGVAEALRGWDYGMEGMRVGSERLIVVPKHLAYSTQSGPVPGKAKNSPHLNFEVELVDMQ